MIEPIKLNTDRMQWAPVTEPESVEMPRKITNFRVVMERRLGIDWEHEPIPDTIEEENEDLEDSAYNNSS